MPTRPRETSLHRLWAYRQDVPLRHRAGRVAREDVAFVVEHVGSHEARDSRQRRYGVGVAWFEGSRRARGRIRRRAWGVKAENTRRVRHSRHVTGVALV